ncbi:ASKHA domain-containing protein [Brucepastera parasyntrophica]|uniref:ASKHA domain-containing protein n=1 Tax=Brucepastera parasyntrophica TaxID=2880008 RepID=UPI00210BE48D|nr:ASKHA domain-containing protein [Brucepastera parasyntrophica]ULQ59022.1 ASKHA domain-containing protein [Brucepastera parasyntrophica]
MNRFVVWGNGEDTLYTLMPPDFFSGMCGGQGICGKCRVTFLSKPPAPAEKEREFLGTEELEAGVRLACFCRPGKNSHTIAVPEIHSPGLSGKEKSIRREQSAPRDGDCGIAIDIGTTTISMQLLAVPGGIVLAGNSYLNSQRYFGADVISRLKASSEGKETRLGEMLRSDILRGIEKILDDAEILPYRIVRIVIAANTVMDHFLLGLPVARLGTAPFTPYRLEFPAGRFDEIFKSGERDSPLNAVPVQLMPCISTFIGGDIVSGLAALNITEMEGPVLFADIGTNAEMVLSYRGVLLCCSAAAGPAFEGGLSCGTGTVPGAVYSVSLENDRFVYEYFENDGKISGPQGLCGSGVIDFVAESVRAGLIDGYGIPAPVLTDRGYCSIPPEKYG